MLSNASPSTEVTNFWTVGDTVDVSGNMDDQPGLHDDPMNIQSAGSMDNQPGQDGSVSVQSAGNMDNQPGLHDDSVNVQGDGGQFGDPENVVETGQVSDWSPPLSVFFILLFVVLLFFVLLSFVVAIAVAGAGRPDLR